MGQPFLSKIGRPWLIGGDRHRIRQLGIQFELLAATSTGQ